jgi:hypothetical protein
MKTKQMIAAGGLALSLVAGIGLGVSVAEAAAPMGAAAKTHAVATTGEKAGVEQVNYYHRHHYHGRPYYGRPYYGRPYWGPPVVYRPYRPVPYYYAPVPYYAPPAYYYPY